MHPQSSAYKLLVSSYRLLLRRMQAYCRAAAPEIVLGRQGRLLIERLQPRLLMSVTASGSETLVNTTTTGSQYAPAIAMDRAGASVIVWTSAGSTTSIDGGQYNASGTATGSAFQVNVSGVGSNPHPSVAMDTAGGFVVCWDSGSSVFARLYNSAGAPLTGETQVATNKVGLSASCVAMTQGGAFMVVWEGDGSQDSDGIYARQFTASGLASGAAFLVNTTTTGVQTNPAVAADPSGDYVVAWTDESSGSKVKAVYLPASGTASSEIEVGGTGTDTEDQASVGFDGSGNFIVTWAESSPGYGIYSRRYEPGGTAIDSAPVLVSSYNAATQVGPAVAFRLDGSYLISWTDTSGHDGSGNGVFAQAYTSAGATDGAEFLVNTTTSGNQQDAGVAWAGSTADIVWEGNGAGVFVQHYTTSEPANQAPVNTVPAATQNTIENNPLTFSTANSNAISVGDADAYGGTEQVTLTVSDGTLAIANASGITFVSGAPSGGGGMSITGTIASLDAALAGLVFTPANNNVGTATLQIITDDLENTGSGGPLSTTRSVTIDISAPSDPTNNVIPGAQTTTLDTPLVFMPANGNAISVGSSWDDVELTATHGTLTLSTTGGLSFSSGTGTGDTTMEFSGSQSAMNDALNGLIYTPTTGYTGSAQVQVTTIIPPILGLLFGSSQASTIAVTVNAPTAVNQAPAPSVPAAQSTDENANVVFSSPLSNAISVADADGNTEKVTLVATSGTVTLHGTGGLSFTSGTGANDSSEVFSGTLANINAALNGISFLPAPDFVGSGGIYVSFNDLGSAGTGSALTTSATVAVTMLDVPPTVATAAAALSPVIGTTTALSVLGASDNGESNLTYTWATTGTPPAPVTFSDNGDNTAQNTIATFAAAGTYNLQVTITDVYAGSVTSATTVNVNQTATAVVVSPASPTLGLNSTEQFSAVVDDQFGNALASQPSVSWSLAGGAGAISGAGLYTAPDSASTATVAAAAASVSGSASVSIVAAQQTLVVVTADDVDNGNTSSDSALLADPGADGISLREAILAANNTPETTLIQFDIGSGGSQTISVTSALPTITEPVIIDGTSQPGFAGAPLIVLNGSQAGSAANGLTITAGNSTVHDLVIDGFGGSGIELSTNGNDLIEGNYIGTNATGTSSDPNAAWGIDVASGSSDTIGDATAGAGNVISGNTQGSIRVTGGSFLVCEDNSVVRVDAQTGAVLATYATGLADDSVAVGPDGSFYVPDYYNNVIRHYDVAGNLLSTFGSGHLDEPQDMIVGPNGNLYVGNVGDGIQEFSPSGTFLSTFVDNGTGGLDNVKGMVFGPNGNLYVANLTYSDVLQFNGTTNALVGTFVSDGSGGLSGPEDLAFGPDGNLYVSDYYNDSVDRYNGSTGAPLGTFISGIPADPYGLRFDAAGNLDVACRSNGLIRTYNGQTGTFIHNLVTGLTNPAWFTATPMPSEGDTIQGNYIGTGANGVSALGNGGDGIRLDSRVSGNSVGGSGAGQPNTIAFNSGDGVDVGGAGQVTISRNSIYENDKFGIDLTSDVATSNSGTLNSADPNDGMNYPVLISADDTDGQLTVAGYVGSAPNQSAFADATVELFQDNASEGTASGQTYLGSLTSNAEGNFAGTISAGPLAAGNSVTATATFPSGDTSQFAAGQAVDFAPTVAEPASASPNPATGTTTALSVLGASDAGESNLTYTWAVTGTPPASVTFSINGTNAAQNTTATFTKTGDYNFQVTITDADGLTATSSVAVTVSQMLTSITVTPATASLDENATQQFSATAYDQFGAVLAAQPSFTWSSTGVGSVSASGLYTAPGSGSAGTASVTANNGSVTGSASVTVIDSPPTVATPASASPSTVTGTTTSLSALGASDGGESNLTYTWATTATPPAPVTFSDNGDNSAKNTTATFTKAGSYNFKVTITDASGLTTTSSVAVTVSQTFTSIGVTPSTPLLDENATQQFSATAYDQFGVAMATQPSFTWSGSGIGSVSASGLYTAPGSGSAGTATVTADSGSISGSASVTVIDSPPTVATPASASPSPVTGNTTSLSVLGASDGGESNLIYTWATTGTPPAPVTFSDNGDNSAKDTTATFTLAGTYTFRVTITDASGLSTTSSVSVTVNQMISEIIVTPSLVSVPEGTTQQCTAVAYDQFGNALATQPALTWSLSGGGSINQSGLWRAPAPTGTSIIRAISGSYVGLTELITVARPADVVPPGADPGTSAGITVNGYSSSYVYTWSAISKPAGAPQPTFSENASTSAVSTTVTVYQAGSYLLICNFGNANGSGTRYCITVALTVEQTATSIQVTPSSAALIENGTQQFTATAADQFGNPMSPEPTFDWSVASGTGSVSQSGLYTAAGSPGMAMLQASSGSATASASVTVTDTPPTVAIPASATPSPVTGTTTTLSVLGASDGGESNLTYTWATTGTPPAPVTFSDNGDNSAKNTTATFTKAGSYSFRVTITDANGLTTTSSVAVTVSQTLTSIGVTPGTALLAENATQQFSATAFDQFGAALATQPSFSWSSTGVGSVSVSGLYTAPGSGFSGTATVTARSGSVSGSASVTVTDTPPTVATPASASPNPVTGTTTRLSVLGASDGGESNLTYTWATTVTPPASVTFSDNGDNTSKNTTARFTEAGTYNFRVTITDASGLSTSSSMTVTVVQTATSVAVTPANTVVAFNATQQYAAIVFDQFGDALSVQPAITWSVATGAGSVSASGLYTAPASATMATVNARASGVNGSASISVVSSIHMLVVDTSSDIVDGNTSSDSALLANPGADGKISLREAIMAADNTPGLTQIDFDIPGSGTQTIAPTSALPAITSAVIIDGTSQPGYSGTPLVQITGASAGASANGLELIGGDSIVEGLAINQFSSGDGILILAAGGDTIAANEIGTNAAGTSAAADYFGVAIIGVGGNIIGGTAGTSRNVISGNTEAGVCISGAGAGNNLVEGNYLGLNATGTAAVGNLDGVYVANGAANNTIGGTATGVGNVISGNDAGVYLDGAMTTGNVVQSNYIGTNTLGTAAVPNTSGILIDAANNVIGATAAGAGNVISGNTGQGILLDGTLASGNVVQGNYIGTNATANAAVGNLDGVYLENGAADNTIGGTTPGSGNVISGNGADGIEITGAGANGNLIEGDYIGTDRTGSAGLGNAGIGVLIETAGNTVGGGAAGAGNVISGNGDAGVRLTGSSATGNLVQGNYIGVNAAGTAALGNAKWGVILDNGADDNFVGTNGDGVDDATEGNVIAASADDANVSVQAASDDVIAGNFIGTNAAGTAALGGGIGIWVTSGSANTRIGTNADGISDTDERNTISGNGDAGVLIDSGSTSTIIAGNYIGTNAAGTAALANGTAGILIDASSTGTVIGGTSAVAGNVISGNGGSGVEISGSGSDDNLVEGDYIGTNAGGTAAVPNADGVDLENGAANNTIGRAATGAGNVISGNNVDGVLLNGAATSGNLIQANYVGTDAAGTMAVPNGDGIYVVNGAANNTIGGTASGSGNVISGNNNDGVLLDGPATTGNVLQGNEIGTDATGTAALPNQLSGVAVADDSSNNSIGGSGASAGNIIANSADTSGVSISNGASGNSIRGNSIYGNNPLGIDLRDDGVVDANTGSENSSLANDGMNSPVFTTVVWHGAVLTIGGYVGSAPNQSAFAGAFVDVYLADNSTIGQGKTFLGTLIADANGNFNGTLATNVVTPGDEVTATATDASNNTSEFAVDFTVVNGASIVATPDPVTGTTTVLSVPGIDDGGLDLTYTWSTTGTPPASANFSNNGDNAANNTTATFAAAGVYHFKVQITDAEGLSVTSHLAVTVNQTLTSIAVSPSTVMLNAGDPQQFTATGFDQFGQPMSVQPIFSWSVPNGAGSISNAGLYTAPSSEVIATIDASSGSVFGSASAAIRGLPVLTLSNGSLAYTEGQGAAAIDPQLTVSDPGSGSLIGATVELAGYVQGQDVLAFPGGEGISSTWDSSTGTLSLSGTATVVQYQAALQSVTYTNTSNDPAVLPRTAQITVTDGTLSSTPAGRDIVVTAVDNPPEIAGPGDQIGTEDFALQFSAATGNGISISDPDANGAAEQLSLTATYGTITLPESTGLTFLSGDATSGVSSMTFTGTLANMDADLDGLTFTPLAGYVGPASIEVLANDLGNTGVGGPLTATWAIDIAIEAPPGIVVTPTTGLTTSDNGGTAGFAIALTRPPTAPMTIGLQSSNAAAGMPTVDSLTFTPTDWDDAQEVTVAGFDDTATSATQIAYSVRTLPAQSADPLYAGLTAPDVQLTDLKLPPVVQVSPGMATYLAGSGPVVVDGGVVVQGPAVDVTGATVTFASGYVRGQDNLSFSPVAGISATWDQAAGRLVLSGQAPAADYQAVLQSVSYVNSSQYAQLGTRLIEFAVTNDGGTTTATRPLLVVAGDGPPGIEAPGTQYTTSDLVFSEANDNGITVIDPGVGDLPVQIALTARKGSLTLANSDGVAFTLGSSSGSLAVQFEGSLNEVNPALQGLRFTPFKGYSGPASLLIEVNDLGNTSAGVSQSASAVVSIVVQTPAAPIPTPTPTPLAPAAPIIFSPGTLSFGSPGAYSGGDGSPTNGSSSGLGGQSSPSNSGRSGGGTSGESGAQPTENPEPSAKPPADPIAAPKGTTPPPQQPPTQAPPAAASPTIRPVPSANGPHAAIFGGAIPTGAIVTPDDVQAAQAALSNQSPMWEKLDEVKHDLVEENRVRLIAGSATFVSVGASVVYLAWILRAGSLVSSLLSSMPAWTFVDPLPILDQMGGPAEGEDDDDETLQSIVDGT